MSADIVVRQVSQKPRIDRHFTTGVDITTAHQQLFILGGDPVFNAKLVWSGRQTNLPLDWA